MLSKSLSVVKYSEDNSLPYSKEERLTCEQVLRGGLSKRVNLNYNFNFKTKPFRAGLCFERPDLYKLEFYQSEDCIKLLKEF